MTSNKLTGSEPKPAARGQAARVGEAEWIQAAFDQMVAVGVSEVRIDMLAKQLGVTKGSFYWNFKDRDDFLMAILEYWRRRETLSIIEHLEQSGQSPHDRLRSLLNLPIKNGRSATTPSADLSVRIWARSDVRARRALKEVDELRLRYFTRLFEQMGFGNEESMVRASLAYGYMRAMVTFHKPEDSANEVAVIDFLTCRN